MAPTTDPDLLLAKALWSRSLLIVLVGALVGLAAYGLSTLGPEVFRTSTTLVVDNSSLPDALLADTQGSNAQRTLLNRAQAITSEPVLEGASDLIGSNLTAEQIRRRLDVQPAEDRDVIRIEAEAGTAALAAEVANAVALAYDAVLVEEVETRRDRALASIEDARAEAIERVEQAERSTAPFAAVRVQAAVDQLSALERDMSRIRSEAALYGSGIRVLNPARVPTARAQPQPVRNGLTAGVLAMLGMALFVGWTATPEDPRATRA